MDKLGLAPKPPDGSPRQSVHSPGRSRPMTGPRLITSILCLAGFAAAGFFIWNSGLPNAASQSASNLEPQPARLAFAGNTGDGDAGADSGGDFGDAPEPAEEVEAAPSNSDLPANSPAVSDPKRREPRVVGEDLPVPAVDPRRDSRRTATNYPATNNPATGKTGTGSTGIGSGAPRPTPRSSPAVYPSSGVSSTASGPPRASARRSDNLDQPPAELNIIEPYRTINVAAEEVGTIQEILVREGDLVKQGQILARLNSTVLFAQLAIAEQNSQAQGRLEASLAEMRLREHRLSQLRALRTDGAARQEEVDRAQSELAIAQANVRTAREELESRRLECERIKAQIDSRSVKAPIDGVVVKMLKDVGEFVAPNTPDVLTIVQIDQLIARCNISANMLDRVKAGQEHDIRLATGETVKGMIEFIDPVTDGASQMVTVKLRIDNTHGRFRSGEQCWMPLSE